MKRNNNLYDFDKLEQYLAQRQAGHLEEEWEQALAEDEFLQTTVEGMETIKAKYQLSSLSTFIRQRQEKIWTSFSPLLREPVHYSSNPFVRFGERVQYIWKELQYAQVQLLMGFNCSGLLLLIGFFLWVRYGLESPDIVIPHADVEYPEGFKP